MGRMREGKCGRKGERERGEGKRLVEVEREEEGEGGEIGEGE